VTEAIDKRLRDLGDRIAGGVLLPDDAAWATAKHAWNLAVDQRPVAIVYPESEADIVGTVRFAGELGIGIAFNAGGHNAGTIGWDRDAILLKTERMRGIAIDPVAGRARVEAGVLGKPLAQAAGEHDLCYLSGTSPDVGVLGYTLGGGFSWMIRKYGLASNSVLGVDLVTADGQHRRPIPCSASNPSRPLPAPHERLGRAKPCLRGKVGLCCRIVDSACD